MVYRIIRFCIWYKCNLFHVLKCIKSLLSGYVGNISNLYNLVFFFFIQRLPLLTFIHFSLFKSFILNLTPNGLNLLSKITLFRSLEILFNIFVSSLIFTLRRKLFFEDFFFNFIAFIFLVVIFAI